MDINQGKILLAEEDLKELFGLFSSPSKHEKRQIYERDSIHYFKKIDLSQEYSLTQEKHEYALDAWRAVVSFLHLRGFCLVKEEKIVNLGWIDEDFVG